MNWLVMIVMRRLILHCKRWNRWRKYCNDTAFYKWLVLFKIVKSPSFEGMIFGEKLAAVSFKAYQRLTKSINFIVGVDLAQKQDMTCNNESVLRKEE